jgi:phage gp29-like protein
MQVTAPAWGSMADQLQQLADAASSPQQLQQAMVQAFGDLDSAELVKLMAAAMALAELKGMDSARGEL